MAGHTFPGRTTAPKLIKKRDSLEPELQELLEEALASITAIYRGGYDKSESLSAFYAIQERVTQLLTSLDG